MRSPQEIVMAIAYALKEGKKGERYTVAELSKKMEMHYVTVRDYLNVIEYVQKNIPAIDKANQKGQARIVIAEELKINLTAEERMLLFMFDKGAFTKDTAISLSAFKDTSVSSAMEKGLVAEQNEKGYLTTEGIIESANYAEKRAETVTGTANFHGVIHSANILASETDSDVRLYGFNEILNTDKNEKVTISDGELILTYQATALLYEQLKNMMERWESAGRSKYQRTEGMY